MIVFDPTDITAARRGDRAALDAVVNAVSGPVFNLAMRMLAHRQDAEDATQEIVIKIITHLGDIRDAGAAGAWAYRIATRHLVNEARLGRVEQMRLGFTGFAADLDQGQRDPDDLGLSAAEYQLALKEVKTGCTLAMLVCLSRPLRMAYILGDVFELTDTEASTYLDAPSGTYRQRLRRARAAVSGFMQTSCGLMSTGAPCRCARRIAPALDSGRITRGTCQIAPSLDAAPTPDRIQADVAQLETAQRAMAIMRTNPEFRSAVPSLIAQLIKTLPSHLDLDGWPGPSA